MMIETASMWLLLNVFSIIVLGFFSMSEMACVSFNKVRLQYYVSKGSRRAIWLNYLLHHPSRLFGTTLIGVNVATVFGSEFARQFHEAIGIDPDLAPLSQVLIVIIFGELAPMFAARRYAEHVALLAVPLIYISSKILAPAIWLLGLISRAANALLGGKEPHPNLFLTQDELEKIIEDQHDDPLQSVESEEFNKLSANIFRLRGKTARQVMNPLNSYRSVSSQMTIGNLRKLISSTTSFVPVYHRDDQNIVGIAYIRDLIQMPENRKVRDCCEPPWFISENTPLIQILKQFRRNNENVAVILNEHGKAGGILHLDDILEELFGKGGVSSDTHQVLIEKTIPGDMSLDMFNKEFNVNLESEDPDATISDYLIEKFEHHPEEGEVLSVGPYDLIIKDSALLEIKSIHVKTKL